MSKSLRRLLARLLALFRGANMAVPTFVAGAVLTAAQLNTISTALTITDAWTAFTPSLTQSGAVTKTVTHAQYIKVGRWVNVRVQLDITGNGTAANQIVMGLPVTAVSVLGGLPDGTAFLLDSSSGLWYAAFVVPISTTTVAFWSPVAGSTTSDDGLGVDTFTAALASGDRLLANFSYQSAA